ncbi:Flp family type IVb pilin [Sphingomonas nostoxanthinifaciens]|uniref:Flp family type IVb pilin n=1 Tax=Sphingomonas nostoxanthinifaciens TaxID=2872652 RepID=UPI001CC21420|nr:Flp family type IVb pilin [Sphingomonas nostoxanthinifaciens]UAK23007.1 Flp family type IVb pilin [Sphingomonas nostoxanthinifaciens]
MGITRLIGKLLRAQDGATAIEYGLILALIFVVMVGGVSALGSSTHGAWSNVSNKVAAAEPF